ncbi:hypothetical protein HHK36_011044 [Tetracentron sinense]|uniref:Pentatricopeptide repeat-containing protein n=1 Tax=Tetracentron sinense TaxID=13715 RepID=A0A834ZFH1_TETSI|nr:hypothetical protein HHK36_011044 [Tetracentron sinense]
MVGLVSFCFATMKGSEEALILPELLNLRHPSSMEKKDRLSNKRESNHLFFVYSFCILKYGVTRHRAAEKNENVRNPSLGNGGDADKMFLYFSVFHLRRSLAEPARTINLLFSRAITNCNHPKRYPDEDFQSWNGQISSHFENESISNELERNESVPTPYLLNKFIAACAKSASFSMGEQAHSVIIKLGFKSNVFISSALVNMYCKCDEILSAQNLFDEMPEQNVVTWNSLICGYLRIQFPTIAIGIFLEMLRIGMAPTPFTISAVLGACSQLEAGELGIQVHGLILKSGFGSNVVVGTGLVDMYLKYSSMDDSRRVFNQMPDRNVVTWTTLVSGYAQNQQPNEAMILVREMRRLGLRSNSVTYNSLLSSFSGPEDVDHCKQVHCQIIHEGMESNTYLVVTLVTVYSECGSLEDFRKICSTILTWDQISWNAVIAGLSHLGNGEEAIKCFTKMRQTCFVIDFFTFTSVLKSIGIISALEEGKQTHALVFKTGYAMNVYVQNGLVSMYARCGAIDDSKWVFSLMDKHDLISWNSLLSGCAHHGYGNEAVELFEQMRRTGVKPDQTTFLSVISACSHVGLLDEGLMYFDLMRYDDLLEPPRTEHYACMVDLFGRAGYLHEAEAFVNSMPINPGPSVYKALLSACQVHGNMDIAIRSAKKLMDLYPNDPAAYVLLSNVLAIGGYWDDAAGVRKLMCDRGVRKKPGCSWIEINKQDMDSYARDIAGDRLCTGGVSA